VQKATEEDEKVKRDIRQKGEEPLNTLKRPVKRVLCLPADPTILTRKSIMVFQYYYGFWNGGSHRGFNSPFGQSQQPLRVVTNGRTIQGSTERQVL